MVDRRTKIVQTLSVAVTVVFLFFMVAAPHYLLSLVFPGWSGWLKLSFWILFFFSMVLLYRAVQIKFGTGTIPETVVEPELEVEEGLPV